MKPEQIQVFYYLNVSSNTTVLGGLLTELERVSFYRRFERAIGQGMNADSARIALIIADKAIETKVEVGETFEKITNYAILQMLKEEPLERVEEFVAGLVHLSQYRLDKSSGSIKDIHSVLTCSQAKT